MHYISEILKTHPSLKNENLIQTIESCVDCAAVCRICADACLSEDQVAAMVRCIKLNLQCEVVCQASAEVLIQSGSLGSEAHEHQLRACITVMESCAKECAKHASMHEHCQICEKSCRSCIDACRRFLSNLKAAA